MSASRFRVHRVHLLAESGHVVKPGCCVDPTQHEAWVRAGSCPDPAAVEAWGVYLADSEGREEWEADFATEREARSYVENREEGGEE